MEERFDIIVSRRTFSDKVSFNFRLSGASLHIKNISLKLWSGQCISINLIVKHQCASMIIPSRVKMNTFSQPFADVLSKTCKIMGVDNPCITKAYGLLTEKQPHISKNIRRHYIKYGFPHGNISAKQADYK